MNFFPLINVKMPIIVGILTFMSRKNSIIILSDSEKEYEFLNIFIFISIKNFMLSLAEHNFF